MTDAEREHPADDAAAVDEDWLRSMGFRFIDHPEYPCWVINPNLDTALCRYPAAWILEEASGGRSESVKLPKQPQTRGDVRCLCAALGIPLAGERGRE